MAKISTFGKIAYGLGKAAPAVGTLKRTFASRYLTEKEKEDKIEEEERLKKSKEEERVATKERKVTSGKEYLRKLGEAEEDVPDYILEPEKEAKEGEIPEPRRKDPKALEAAKAASKSMARTRALAEDPDLAGLPIIAEEKEKYERGAAEKEFGLKEEKFGLEEEKLEQKKVEQDRQFDLSEDRFFQKAWYDEEYLDILRNRVWASLQISARSGEKDKLTEFDKIARQERFSLKEAQRALAATKYIGGFQQHKLPVAGKEWFGLVQSKAQIKVPTPERAQALGRVLEHFTKYTWAIDNMIELAGGKADSQMLEVKARLAGDMSALKKELEMFDAFHTKEEDPSRLYRAAGLEEPRTEKEVAAPTPAAPAPAGTPELSGTAEDPFGIL